MAQIVKQSTIDEMKKIGMSKAIERANSGTAGSEFTEGARRMYGKRIKSAVGGGPKMSNKMEPKQAPHGVVGYGHQGYGHIEGDTVPLKGTTSPTVTKTSQKPQGQDMWTQKGNFSQSEGIANAKTRANKVLSPKASKQNYGSAST